MPWELLEWATEVIRDRKPTVIIEGGATGADSIAARAAVILQVPCVVTFKADWSMGRRAGPVRNQRMLDEGRPDLVLAFTHPLGISVGTADMVRRAKRAGVEVEQVQYPEAAP